MVGKKENMKRIILILLILVLAGVALLYFTGGFSEIASLLKPEDTTASAPPSGNCGFVWATQPLPDISAALQQKLERAEVPAVEVKAAAYGENCVLADGTVDRFLTMQTDLYFIVPVVDIEDQLAMGEAAEKIIAFVLEIPEGTLPGSQGGYIQINYKSALGQMESLWFRLADGQAAIESGLQGAKLLEKLRNPF